MKIYIKPFAFQRRRIGFGALEGRAARLRAICTQPKKSATYAPMPLVKSASPAAFSENVRREVTAGKPQKQAVAIAYSVKRQKLAKALSGKR